MVELLGEFGFSIGGARVALSRLVRRGLLERSKNGRIVMYRLTPRSEKLLIEGDRRIFALGMKRDWDDTWTILWHSIPEQRRVERSRLGRRLRFLGFGSVQERTWISPYDREEEVVGLVEELDVVSDVGVILGHPARTLQIDRLIGRAWDLVKLQRRYEGFVEEFSPYGRKTARRRLDDREAFLVRTRLVHQFRGFPFLDPDLPDVLMPEHQQRDQAVKLFHEVYEDLAEAAARHFDAVVASPHPAKG